MTAFSHMRTQTKGPYLQFGTTFAILKWRKLVFPTNFPTREVLWKGKDVENEFLQFDSIVFGRFYRYAICKERLKQWVPAIMHLENLWVCVYLCVYPAVSTDEPLSTHGIFFCATWCCNFLSWWAITSTKKLVVKKWLQIFPALKVRRPSLFRRSAVAAEISEYSTTCNRRKVCHRGVNGN